MYYRLSALMFLVYAIPGAWMPLFSLRLEEELHFTPLETALAYAAWPVGGIIASLAAGQVADRLVSVERCLAACSLIGGALMLVLAEATHPPAVVAISVALCLFLVPVVTFSTTYCLTHLPHPEKEFGRVRLWGTVGWILPGLFLGLWFRMSEAHAPLPAWLGREGATVADSLRLAGLLALCLSVYALSLPHTPPLRQARSWLAPLQAAFLLRHRAFAVFCLCAFLINITVPFNIQLVSLRLRQLGLDRQVVAPVMTIAQWSEVAVLWLMPVLALRMRMRSMLFVGLAAWTAELAILSASGSAWPAAASLLLGGVMICCFIVRGQVFIARQAGPEIRASAQALATTLNAAGLLLGHILVGWVREAVNESFPLSFAVGAAIGAGACVIFALGFAGAEEASGPRWWFRRPPARGNIQAACGVANEKGAADDAV